ncbi:acrylyl-CoA reductase (NADPH) [Pseudoxanthomonas sp. GM95]|uniref:MDR family oxidoreductase n=1 Tax=Pseudoxanthomonas sp. GM95 TaxID=1881043 RepID=UPI0008C618E9|nr:MDR family oxidoreductase [Pseudoxanthomonas sp. GM95]SEL13957.1 acrylyl-CoA reductase (NADPH) [Pseudoxanthomonas sp. GM95]
MSFRALLASRSSEGEVTTKLETLQDDALVDGNVDVDIAWSNLNYKDAIALAGFNIIQSFPLVPGIDFAGTVTASQDPHFKPGDSVVATGWNLSQTHNGGFAQRARVPGDWLINLPDAIDTRNAMAIGTAGLTAMLSVLALEQAGLTPARGEVLVTGATGGVGSVAIALLAALGYRVVASSGKPAEADYLRKLGAAEVIAREKLSQPGPPVAAERWAGAIDSVGGQTLANVLAQTSYRGAVTTCGFVGGRELPATVLPFILRGVTLAGIDSVQAPHGLREQAWKRLASDLDLNLLASTLSEIPLDAVPDTARQMLGGSRKGRTLVNVNR